jgi:hypothetical protein
MVCSGECWGLVYRRVGSSCCYCRVCAWASRMPVQMFSVAEELLAYLLPDGGEDGCDVDLCHRSSGFRVFEKESELPASGVAYATPTRMGGSQQSPAGAYLTVQGN